MKHTQFTGRFEMFDSVISERDVSSIGTSFLFSSVFQLPLWVAQTLEVIGVEDKAALLSADRLLGN